MSFDNNNNNNIIEPEDWLRRLFSSSGLPAMVSGSVRSGSSRTGRRTEDWFGDDHTFAGFDQMRRQMEKMFEEQLEDVQAKAPKELVREYETPEGGKVREIGPIVYGYSATIGPDGKPRVREFGNVRHGMKVGISTGIGLRGVGERARAREGGGGATQITAEREPLSDVITTDKEVKVVVELPGANKENIKVNAYEDSVEVKADAQDRKYRRVVDIPAADIDVQSVKSTFKNGLLEIVFKRKDKPKGKEVKVE